MTLRSLPSGFTFRFTPGGPTYRKLGRSCRYQLLRHDGTPMPGMTYDAAERSGGADAVILPNGPFGP